MGDLPTGTVTFLFTDLEESTRLWELDADAMGEALAVHDEVLRRAVESRRTAACFAVGGTGLPRCGSGLEAVEPGCG